MTESIELYEFSISHYCEKARWALERLSVPYTSRVVLPGLHVASMRKIGARRTTVPVLVSEGLVVQGSSAIVDWAELRTAQAALTPLPPEERAAVLAWEERADREVGRALRVVLYDALLRRRGLVIPLWTQGGPWYGSAFYTAIYPLISTAIRKSYRIDPEGVDKASAVLERFLDDMDARLEEGPWMAGAQFTRADLTTAALLAPACMPPEHPVRWPDSERLPEVLRAWRARHTERPWYQWVLSTYRTERKRS